MAVSFGYKNLITLGFENLFGVSITEHTSNIVNRFFLFDFTLKKIRSAQC
jgi:hypothetical protein